MTRNITTARHMGDDIGTLPEYAYVVLRELVTVGAKPRLGQSKAWSP